MEMIAMPFIFIYHVVHYILLSPKRILSYAHTGVLSVIDKLSRGKISKRREEKAKEDSAIMEVESMMNATRKSANKKATLSKEPEFSFRYKIRGSNGKIINGTFEGPSADEVKIFLQNEGYEVLEVVPRKFYDIDVNIGGKFKAADLSLASTQYLVMVGAMQFQLHHTYKKLANIYKFCEAQVFNICPQLISNLNGDYLPSYSGMILGAINAESKLDFFHMDFDSFF